MRARATPCADGSSSSLSWRWSLSAPRARARRPARRRAPPTPPPPAGPAPAHTARGAARPQDRQRHRAPEGDALRAGVAELAARRRYAERRRQLEHRRRLEVFTPVSTLQPCSNYTLTVWARTSAAGHTQLGRRRRSAARGCPPIAAAQQALARLGYLGATLQPSVRRQYPLRAPDAPRSGGPRLPPAPRQARPPPLRRAAGEDGSARRDDQGSAEVYQSDHGLEATGEPELRDVGLAVGGRDRQQARPQALHVGDGVRVLARDARGPPRAATSRSAPPPTPAFPAPKPNRGSSRSSPATSRPR